jgi:Ca2+-binding RTX toxin-like protein
LTGGSSTDYLFGDAGKDSLYGKGGNNFLVGGDDSDRLESSSGRDVLIAGTLSRRWTYDEISTFLADWAAGRNPQTTKPLDMIDSDSDTLIGGSGRDLFRISTGDSIDTRRKDGDVII